MKIAMIGAGYVGLVSGACLSEFGHIVTCVDRCAGRIERLNAGEIPIFEPGLDTLVAENVADGRLCFATDLAGPVSEADAVFIAVGTPTRRGDGHADLSYVYAAAEEIGRALTGYTCVVTKSTVPVGAGADVAAIVRKTRPDLAESVAEGDGYDVVSNPEFLREGSAIEDFMRPDRVVIGAPSERARALMRRIYRPLSLIETPLLFTDRQTSEMIKYAANTFLATKITFINEVADLCEKVGADVHDVAKGIGLDRRIGPKFLHPGPGYGGSCFPKDTLAFVKTAQEFKAPLRIIETVVDINNKRKRAMAHRVARACGGDLKDKTLAVLGLTFKPNTDDMRDSPSLDILPALIAQGAVIRAFDPEGMADAKQMIDGVAHWATDAYDAAAGADCVVIVTEWNQFRALQLDRLKKIMNQPLMVDLRNVYNPDDMAEAGFDYHCVGRSRTAA